MLIWLTNHPKNKLSEFLSENSWKDIVTRGPKPTERYTASELIEMGMVGLYRTSKHRTNKKNAANR